MFSNGRNRQQLVRILRAQDDVDAAHSERPCDGSGGPEADLKIIRAVAVRDRAIDNASDRTQRKALRMIAGRTHFS